MKTGLSFTKMHGLGNDFMIVDATTQPFSLTPADIRALADRRRGVGFDQLLVLAPPPSEAADFTYLIFNSDGTSAEQCGNGARCMARFIEAQSLSSKKTFRLMTAGKLTTVSLEPDHQVTVEMNEPYFDPALIGFTTPQPAPPYTLKINNHLLHFAVVGVGNPHAVISAGEEAESLMREVGAQISTHSCFSQGINVGFMHILSPQHIRLHVYERGTGPTLACGSGACAAVASGRRMGLLQDNVQVTQPGGDLWITWRGPGSSLKMRGPAEFVYQGNLFSDKS